MIDYRKYTVWQKAHLLVLELYAITEKFPKKEQFNLISQINRAVVSVPTNIAEGCGRETQKELIRYLYIASGSAHELEYLVLVSKDLNYIDDETFKNLSAKITEVKKMLASLIRTISKTL